MPRVRIYNQEQYIKAIEVLDRVGGGYQGVGMDEWYLLVNLAQYEALLEAEVVTPDDNGAKEQIRGKRGKKKA